MRVVGIIPSRYASTRLPKKSLKILGNKSIVQHVYEKAKQVELFDDVIIATDHEEIMQEIERFGGNGMMTSDQHETGTDRIAEVAQKIECDIVVNIQGDEPFIKPITIQRCFEPLINDQKIVMATLKHLIDDAKEIEDPNVVKVVTDINDNALYFSRSPIPFYRIETDVKYYRHIGIYAFQREFLIEFADMPQTPLARIESLEQLRALENGYKIKVLSTEDHPLGIDTEEDYQKAKKIMKDQE
ncbi:MAG: 3-deoxy-manno-octulosonate cytidylyltransferase [Planctomycetota bacterium]|nr:MAG: 3-deoxy-manno-octulosonate cytidylyltransferase [Planctomycetota bacterium]